MVRRDTLALIPPRQRHFGHLPTRPSGTKFDVLIRVDRGRLVESSNRPIAEKGHIRLQNQPNSGRNTSALVHRSSIFAVLWSREACYEVLIFAFRDEMLLQQPS